ncbi:MAG: hypothetical protein AAGB51_03225 [Planctomycetota bacterium]
MRTLATILTLAAASAAVADVPRLLISPDLTERLVRLTAIDGDLVEYETETGLLRREPASGVLALLEPDGARIVRPEPEGAWLIELTDGQRLFGAPGEGDGRPDAVAWESRLVGMTYIDLDRIDRIERLGTFGQGNPAEAGSDDLVVLTNGDVVQGFLLAFGPDGTELDAGGAELVLPLERVASVDLATPESGPSGVVLRLADGSVVAAQSLSPSSAAGVAPGLEVSAAPFGTVSESVSNEADPFRAALADIRSVVFDAAALRPLSSVEPEQESPVGDRRWTPPMDTVGADTSPIGAGDLVIPGPMEIRWRLPEDASRIAFDAELANVGPWAACDLVVLLADGPETVTELARLELSEQTPRGRINEELGGAGLRRLVIRLEPGRFGPIRDRVILRRPLLLIGE